MWFVTCRRHDADLAAARDEQDRLRAERNDARTERAAFRTAATVSARQFAEADAANVRLTGRNRRLAELLAEQPRVPRTRLNRALAAAARYLAAYHAEQRRADLLQARLDDAVGLYRPDVDAGAMWQARRMDKPRPAAKEASTS